MDDFLLYLKIGLFHVLDKTAYDHILFLIVLAVVFTFKEFKNVLWLVTLFTIGHSITLALAAYDVVKLNVELIEFLIPATIFITGVVNIFTAKKTAKFGFINLFFAAIFGLIHGLGFSNFFRMMIGQEESKLLPLAEFALGIELAQIIVVLSILILGYVCQTLFKINKRDWILVLSSIVVGFATQMMIDRVFW